MTEPDPPPVVWLTRDELAARLILTKSTLAGWAVTGDGPRFAKMGRHVRYKLTDVTAWENAQFVDRAEEAS